MSVSFVRDDMDVEMYQSNFSNEPSSVSESSVSSLSLTVSISFLFSLIFTIAASSSMFAAAAEHSLNKPKSFVSDAHYSEGGILTLEGLDPTLPLTQADVNFLQETIRKVLNEYYEEDGVDLFTLGVTLNEESFSLPGEDESSTRPSLRGSDRSLLSDHEMCEYQSGPKKGEIIPGCEWNFEFYNDCYCHHCIDDDVPNMIYTRTPTLSPTKHPYTAFLDDDDLENGETRSPSNSPTKWSYEVLDDDDVPNWTAKPTNKSTPAPTKSPTKSPSKNPTPPPIRVVRKPNTGKKVCNELQKNRSSRFGNARNCRFKNGMSRGRGRGAN